MRRLSLLLNTFFLFLLIANAQVPDPPKREFRGLWIATVKNIDWPSRSGLRVDAQKAELRALLDSCVAHNLNAVVLQVRPAGDALYSSPYEPWSEVLMGTAGRAPRPFYDPLEFAIRECHQRGLALHAWINPFRVSMTDPFLNPQPMTHLSVTHPDWVLVYGGRAYLDPGIPAARAYVAEVILDIARRYDVDAIHFDDYFYPYRIEGTPFPDTASFAVYGSGSELEDWRRENVDVFVEAIGRAIKAEKPDMMLGISPFGVWRNFDVDPLGSATRAGQTSYDDLFADVRKWAAFEWIDYVAPQLYFSIGYPAADYKELVDWWSRNSFGRHLYIGHSLYKINNNADINWRDARQIQRQIAMNRTYGEVDGSVYFSAKWIRTNPLGVMDSLVRGPYRYRALPPNAPWIDALPPRAYADDPDASSGGAGISVSWEAENIPDDARYVAIYRYPKKQRVPIATAPYLAAVLPVAAGSWTDPQPRWLHRYTYALTALDRHFNESEISEPETQRQWAFLKRKKEDRETDR